MSWVSAWNTLAADALAWVTSASVAFTVSLTAATLLWLVVRRRASAHFGQLLFLFTLLPLVLPAFGTLEERCLCC